jgi:glycosyltransferase involved in cell wall biosynthesis
MRVLILTKIFPNRLEPLSAPFNRRQFAALSRLCDVEVLATIPWFPGASAFGRWSSAGRLTTVPEHECIDGVLVQHPRFAFVPKFGSAIAGPLYAASLARAALARSGRVDVVLGSWAYPDGFAAVVLADMLGVPAVIKLHGSDMNVVARWRAPRRYLEWALPRAARVVAVSRQLAAAAAALGAAPERIDVVPNGVDRQEFKPRDRGEARAHLGLPESGKMVLFVGHLTEPKGAGDLIRAFALAGEALRDTRLVMVGDGEGSAACRVLAAGLGERVSFVGAEPHERIPLWLAACDALALPSWNEGMPNVVLEALACGRAVVASNVGGIPDVLDGYPHALVPPREPAALALALERVLRSDYEPSAVAERLARPDWEGSARLLHQSLLAALGSTASEAA